MKQYIKRGRWDEADEYEEAIDPPLKPVNTKPIEPCEAGNKKEPEVEERETAGGSKNPKPLKGLSLVVVEGLTS